MAKSNEENRKEMEAELSRLLAELEERSNVYGICDTKLGKIPAQGEVLQTLIDRLSVPFVDRVQFMLYFGGNGAGKCHRYEDKVLMYDGSFKMAGEIKVGDVLMGPDSTKRTVDGIGSGYGEMFKITPESGEPIYVNGDHQLMLVHRRRNRNGLRIQNGLPYAPEGDLVQISVYDYLKKSPKWKAEACMWRPNSISYSPKQLSVDPYFLGVWLGDGNTDTPGITSIDPEIIEYVGKYADSLGLSLRQSGITYFLKKNVRSRYGFSGYSLLREIGVLGDKHIPLDYLTSSREQRLELLAGLIDTDGEYDSRRPRFSITQKSERLARDIMQLARSLGFRCSITETVKVCTNATREDYVPGTYFRVSINGDVWNIPTKLKRKQYEPQIRRHDKDPLVSKFMVESAGEDMFYGFSVDRDHLYMDENFIVQHNTFLGAYVTVCLMLGHEGKKYGLPFLGTKKEIWICTESGSNVQSVIEPYLLGEGSATRIPPEEIDGVPHMDNKILKGLSLKNGTHISVKTYEQGYKKFQGGSPDWIWCDEEPTDQMVCTELIARVRKTSCEMILTMTPLNGLTRFYDFFMKTNDEEMKAKTRVWHVSSLDNPYTSKLWTKGLTPEEYRLRVLGSFESPTGLVYNMFNPTTNVVQHIDPDELPEPKFYKAIDFGTSHPTAVVFVAKDGDGNIYVFDEYKKSNALISEIASEVNARSAGYEFEWFIRDSASAREGLELKNVGLTTTKVNKKIKGENEMSNRRSGIMLVNQLFHNNKLFISDRCKQLIMELQTHYYKDGNRDGEVIKENDDLLDALRYCIFTIHKPTKEKTKEEKLYERRYGETVSGIRIAC